MNSAKPFLILGLLYLLVIYPGIASEIQIRFFYDYRINGHWKFEGIGKIANQDSVLIPIYRFTYDGETLKEIAYVFKGSCLNRADGISMIKLAYPSENELECTFYDENEIRTTNQGTAKWLIKYSDLFINRMNYDSEGNFIKDDRGIFQYSYQLYENGLIRKRLGKDKKYRNVLDNAGVYQTIYTYDEYNNESRISYFNKDGSRYYSGKDGFSSRLSIYDSAKNVIEVRYYDSDNRPFISQNCNCFTVKNTLDENHQLIEKRFYDIDFNLTLDGDYSAAIHQLERNECAQIVRHSYLDSAGNLTPRKNFGFAIAEVDFDSKGREIEKRYYDVNSMLMNIKHGYAKEIFRYNDDENIMVEYNTDKDGRIITYNSEDHFAIVERTYNADGTLQKESYFDPSGNPTSRDDDGYHQILFEYNSRKNVSTMTYLGIEGDLKNLSGGFAHVENIYDYNGHLHVQFYFNSKYEPVNRNDGGYASIRWIRNEAGEVPSISYFDADQMPGSLGDNGYHKYQISYYQDIQFEYEELCFYDEEEKLTVTPKNSYAKRIYKYDLRGNLVEERYEDSAGKLKVPYNNTYAKVIHEYNDESCLTKTAYFDEVNHPIVNSKDSTAFAVVEYSYDENGHWYRKEWFDAKGNLIDAYYRADEKALFGIHAFRYHKIQLYVFLVYSVLIIAYLVLRKKIGFVGENRRLVGFLLLPGIGLVLIGLLLLSNKTNEYIQFQVLFVFDLFMLLILLLSMINRKIISVILFVILLLGIFVNYLNTINNYFQFAVWWTVFYMPILFVSAYLLLSSGLARWKKLVFPLATVLFLSILFLGYLFPFTGHNWVKWDDGKIGHDDFRGEVSSDSEYSAAIVSKLFLIYDCENGELKYNSSAQMDRFSSWMNVWHKSDQLLNHEQRHFDIAKIHADILDERLEEIEDPCSLSEEELKEEIDRIKYKVSLELRKTQERYDHETEHGLLTQIQDKWDKYLDKQIE